MGLLWETPDHELLIDLLFKEAERGNKPNGGKYPKGTWETMLEKIYETTGKLYTPVQIRNKYDTTRKAWKIWCQVVDASILKWDPVTRTFGATDEEWKQYTRENPKAVQFKKKVIPCEEKLAFIFKGIIEPGKPYVCRKKRTMNYHFESLAGSKNDDEPSPVRRKRLNGEGSGESESTDVPICTRAEAKRVREAPLEQPIAAVYEYSVGECVEYLDEVKEIERGKELYLFALELFVKKEHREKFVKLKDSVERMAWLLKLRADDDSDTVADA